MDIAWVFDKYITSSVVALVGSVAILWLAWSSRAALASWVTWLQKKLFTRSGFFWTVNIIFMAVSVIHAGVFFGITGNGHDVPGVAQYLGFAVSFFLDLVTIILMQALLEAKYRGEEQKARQLLLFIAICCATSTFANLAISLNDFNAATDLPNAPEWIQFLAPYVLASFPLFVILMSIAAEMIVNVRPLDSLNAEEYEADEQKRVRLMQIRNDYLQRQADEELRALQIRSQMAMNKRMRTGRLPKSYRWPWEKAVDIDAVMAGVSSHLKATYEPQIEALKQQVEDLQKPVESAVIPPVLPTWIPMAKPALLPTSDSGKTTDTPTVKPTPKPPTNSASSGRKSVSVKEASVILDLSESYIRDLRQNGVLKRSSSDKNKILMGSILEYQQTRPNSKKARRTNGKNTDELSAVAPTNGHRKVTQPLGDLVEMRV